MIAGTIQDGHAIGAHGESEVSESCRQRGFRTELIAACLVVTWGVAVAAEPDTKAESKKDSETKVVAVDSKTLPNLFRFPGEFWVGGEPSGEGLAELVSRGVTTVISVDGHPPDVEGARKLGLRYIHLPISYETVPPETIRGIVAAWESNKGGVYVHCHHGKHRGPAAAVAAVRVRYPELSGAWGDACLKQLGTGAGYQGLYRSVCELTAENILALPAPTEFPSSVEPPDSVARMLAITDELERINKLLAADALDRTALSDRLVLLAEHYREAGRHEREIDASAIDLIEQFGVAEKAVVDASRLIATSQDAELRDQLVKRIEATCSDCHKKFRGQGKR
ncbi:MAG: hypothetical protein KF777_03585 [Planctomycetaceae bacterium]|nr:hypothetical protein [Planctomycetaceae bacterium]